MNRPNDIVIHRVLNEKASQQQADEVAAWFATDEGQAWLAAEMERDAAALGRGEVSLLENIPSEEMLRRIERRIGRMYRRRMLFRVAAVLIPCALILGVWLDLSSRLGGALFATSETEEVAAGRGERREIIFQDGSRVFLNAGTRIAYPRYFGLASRRVALDGEAYFEVAPNARRPFVVEMGGTAVKVLGTSFNVKAYAAEPTVDVVLIEGKVEFSHAEKSYLLAPSQRLIFDKDSGNVRISTEAHASCAAMWHDDILSFRDTPLHEVLATLERWYDVRFKVLDSAAYRSTFSLQTAQLPLPELLREMENVSTVRFEIDGRTIRVWSK